MSTYQCFGQIRTAHAQKLFRAFGRSSNTAVGFGKPYLLCGMNILANEGHLSCDLNISPFDPKRLAYISAVMCSNNVPNFSEIEQSAGELLMI